MTDPQTARRRRNDMGKNVGTIDRALRIVIGLVLIALVFVGPQTPWGWIGVVPLATALISWCPIYRLLGFNTCPMPKQG
jgi:Na+/proline symporter